MISSMFGFEVRGFREGSFQIFSQVVQSLLFLALIYFFSSSLGERVYLGLNYFSFALTGFVFHFLFQKISSSIVQKNREWKAEGIFELVASAPHPRWLILLGSGLYPSVLALLQIVFLVLFSSTLLGLELKQANLFGLLGSVFFLFWMGGSVALLCSSLQWVWKKSDFFSLPALLVVLLLSGAYFPVEALPGALQSISYFLPFSHLVDLVRWAFFPESMVFTNIGQTILILCTWSVFLTLASVTLFQVAEQRFLDQGRLNYF